MEISVNGTVQPLEESISVSEFLEIKEIDPGTVVIEINKNILKNSDYQQTMLRNKDQVEILRFVGGG